MKRTLSFYALFFMIFLVLEKTGGILSKIVLARYITPYEYGIITLVVISLPGMFQVLTNFCFHSVLSHAKEGRKSFCFSIVYSLITSLIVGILILFFHEPFFRFLNLPLESWHILFLAFFISLLSVSILGDILGLLRGLKKYRLNNVLSTLPTILKLLFILVAVYFLHVTEFTILLLIFAIPTSIVLFFALIKEQKLIFSSLRPALLPSKNMFLFGVSIFSISAFRLLTEPINRIIISHELGVLWQGYYDVSFTLAAILFFSFGAMQFISVPEATGAKNKEDILEKSGELGDVTRGLFSFLVLGIILLYFYAHTSMQLLQIMCLF
jgi:O-antigen/teichoic acid export membrane protein